MQLHRRGIWVPLSSRAEFEQFPGVRSNLMAVSSPAQVIHKLGDIGHLLHAIHWIATGIGDDCFLRLGHSALDHSGNDCP